LFSHPLCLLHYHLKLATPPPYTLAWPKRSVPLLYLNPQDFFQKLPTMEKNNGEIFTVLNFV
jgi:hypothetical protein